MAINLLFLCTHNSARSILAEALLNHVGAGVFKAYSAGSSPSQNQAPNPLGLKVLERMGISTQGLYSKSWDAFSKPDSPTMDLIITVCDNAAGEACPIWPGHPATAHWGYADPSAVAGSEATQLEAFEYTAKQIQHRLQQFIALAGPNPNRESLQTIATALANAKGANLEK